MEGSGVGVYSSILIWSYMTRRIDLFGQKFGKLNVVSFYKTIRGRAHWSCICDCGNKKLVLGKLLRNGKVKSCGCWASSERILKFPIGTKIGFITIIDYCWHYNESCYYYRYRCICGKKRWTHRPGGCKQNSCDCQGKSFNGLSGTVFSRIKRSAKKRNLSWKVSIKYLWNLFLIQKGKCALSGIKIKLCRNSQKSTASLDRINSNSGYEVGNIHWVHRDVNTIKWDYTESELYNWSKLIYKHNKNKYEPDDSIDFNSVLSL